MPVSHVTSRLACSPLLPREVTEHLDAADQSAFFCMLVDATLDAIIAHRPDGSVVYANKGATDLLGYSPEELLELQPYGWVAPDLMVGAARRIESIIHDGRLTFPSGARRKDGTVVPTEVRSSRVDTALGPIVVAVIRDVSDRRDAEQTLQHLAFHDALTKLGNRALFEQRLSVAIADAKRHGDLLGLAYVDLDEFKPINDHYGHAIGDDVLVEIGSRLRDDVREQDTVARMGGDEFVVLFPRLATREEFMGVAERLVKRIEEPILASGQVLHVKASVGLAFFDCTRDDARSLVVKADMAMYSAKQDPKRPWLLFEDGMELPHRRPGL